MDLLSGRKENILKKRRTNEEGEMNSTRIYKFSGLIFLIVTIVMFVGFYMRLNQLEGRIIQIKQKIEHPETRMLPVK